MKEQFVTYKIALKLKELGFDEPCFGFWDRYSLDKAVELKIEFTQKTNSYFIRAKANNCCLAPLWQQVINWFRENGNLNIELRLNKDGYQYNICNTRNPMFSIVKHKQINSYEESREQAILKAIELCQKEK